MVSCVSAQSEKGINECEMHSKNHEIPYLELHVFCTTSPKKTFPGIAGLANIFCPNTDKASDPLPPYSQLSMVSHRGLALWGPVESHWVEEPW